MGSLISKEKLLKDLHSAAIYAENNNVGNLYGFLSVQILPIIMSQESKVVYCKDCKFCHELENPEPNKECVCTHEGKYTTRFRYCSEGKNKYDA